MLRGLMNALSDDKGLLLTDKPMVNTGGSALELIGLVLIMVAVIAAAYLLTRWISRLAMRTQSGTGKNKLRVVDRCLLAKDRAVMVLELEGRFFLIGVGENIELLSEVDGSVYTGAEQGGTAAGPGNFFSVMQGKLRGKKNMTSPREPGHDTARRMGGTRSQELSPEEMQRVTDQLRNISDARGQEDGKNHD